MKFLIWLFIGAAGIYLAALLLVFFVQRSFMYFPPQGGVSQWFLDEHNEQIIPVQVEGIGTIKSIFQEPPKPSAPVILFFHGNGSAAYQYTEHFEAFQNWGVGYLAAEYPGYSGNSGKPNEKDILATALANYDVLINRGVQPSQIFIYGDSLGGASAVHVAREREARGLILSSTFLSMQAMGRRQMPWFPTGILLRDKYRSDKKMPFVTEPLLQMHGDADELIPHSQGQALHALHKGEKEFYLIKGGRHHLWNTEMPIHIKAFIEKHAG